MCWCSNFFNIISVISASVVTFISFSWLMSSLILSESRIITKEVIQPIRRYIPIMLCPEVMTWRVANFIRCHMVLYCPYLLKRVLSSENVSPNEFVFNAILDNCSNMNDKAPNACKKAENYRSIMQSLQIYII